MANILKKIKDKIYFTLNPPPAKHSFSVSDIFFANCKEKEFLRWDVTVKYLAIENYYGKNDFGFSLYGKMQNARTGREVAETSADNFKKLIISWEENGYLEDSCIYLDNDLTLQNGAHRLAMAIYHNMPYINAYYLHRDKPADFSEKFFTENEFTAEEIAVIKAKSEELADRLNTAFPCIIWAPAFPFADEILEDFRSYGKVSDIRKHTYDKKDFETVVRNIYSVDNIAKWKIDKKLEFFTKYSCELISFNLLMPYPDFKLNAGGDTVVSQICANAKKTIRAKYKDRIEDYIYDIILHTCDNYHQSAFMHKVLSEDNSHELVMQ
ncbi:MAG: hypothetical protein IJD80_02910 [Oscillospiraceae bacterium]|nr:hypothetical protein [Oscillospiraceae bacterium]